MSHQSPGRIVNNATVDLPDGVSAVRIANERTVGVPTGRILVVDRESLLLGVIAARSEASIDDETAIWNADTDFTNVLIRLF